MRKGKLLYFSWIATCLCWLYITVSIITVYYSLEPIQGTIFKVEKSRNRIPVYTVYLKEYNSPFLNEGNGTLSLFKPAPEVNSVVLFYIREADKVRTLKQEPVFSFGLNHYKLVDCYYFVVRPALLHHLLIICGSFLLCCLNALSYALYKTKMSWRVFVVSMLVFFLLMLL